MEKVYAMLYKRELIYDDYYVFIPCHYIQGRYDSSDKSITDNTGVPFYESTNYMAITSNVCLTYSFDFTEKDLINRYQVETIDEALVKYYDELKRNIIVGRIDNSCKCVSLNTIPFEFISDLLKTYNITSENGKSVVKMTNAQLLGILKQDSTIILKEKLKTLLALSNLMKKADTALKTVNRNTSNEINDGEKRLLAAIMAQKPNIQIKNNMCKEIYDYIVKHLVGQDEAVQQLLSIIINNMNATTPKELIKPLIIGQTGSGKTYFFKLLEKKLNVPVIVVDCNLLVQSGYVGESIEDVLANLYLLCNKDIKLAQRAIVYFDEIDKLSSKGADVSDVGVQKALLKFIEGHKYVVSLDRYGNEKITIDTSMMNIVAGGAFENLVNNKTVKVGYGNFDEEKNQQRITTKQLVDFGMIAELIGRFGLRIEYNKVTKEMIEHQLNESLDSPLLINKTKFKRNYGLNLIFSKGYIKRVIEDSYKSNTGFRGSEEIINQSLVKLSFALQYGSLSRKRLTITEDFLNDPDKIKKIGTKK